MTGDRVLGLVRGVERRARHVYGVGARPEAELSGELGGLVPEPGSGRVPVWLDGRGRLLTELPKPPPRPSARTLARWIAEPAAWSHDGIGVRARAAAARTAR